MSLDAKHERRAAALMRSGTITIAAILSAIAVGMIVVALDFSPSRTLGSPGPARLPIIYGVVLVVLCVGMALVALLGRAEAALKVEGIGRAAALAAGTAGFVLVWQHVDFLVVAPLGMAAAALALGSRPLVAGSAALVLTGGIYGIFVVALGVPFP